MANPPLGQPEGPSNLDPHVIAANLQTLHRASANISKFGPLYALPFFDEDPDFQAVIGNAVANKGTDVIVGFPFRFKASGGLPDTRDVQVFARALDALETDATAIFSGGAQNYEVFIAPLKTSSDQPQATILLPYQTAKLLSSAFTYGLATRLLLEKYKANWESDSVYLPVSLSLIASRPIGPGPFPVVSPLNAADWYGAYLSQLSSKLMAPATWTALAKSYKTNGYNQLLTLMTDSSLQMVGMVMGWDAGDQLTAGVGDTTSQHAFWANLHSKYSTVEIGMMVGYTFEFMTGFLASERIRSMASGGLKPPSQTTDPIKAPTDIYNVVRDSNVANKSTTSKVADDFFSFVLAESYAIAPNATAGAEYQGFLQGYQRGLVLAADVMFEELFEKGYALGYTNGFSEGYRQGYAAGWTAAINYQAGQDTWMSGATKILGGLSQVLKDADKLMSNPAVGTVIAAIFA